MTNEAYLWLKKWVDEGGYWFDISNAGVWRLGLINTRSNSYDGVGFRDQMKEIIEAANIGFKLIELNKSDVSSIEYENSLGEILEMANEQDVSTTERTSS